MSVLAQAGDGCGSFEGAEWGVWEAWASEQASEQAGDHSAPGVKLKPILSGSLSPDSILAVLDVDGDGAVEFVVRGSMGYDRVLVDQWGKELARDHVRYNDCPC